MFALQKSRSKTSSRSQIAIKGVRDGILILPADQYRVVLKVSSLNFELRSEEEQDAIIDNYESFLNSVGTSLQILIRTREIDMDKYLEDLGTRLDNETEPVYRDQLTSYDEFIRSLISSNTILTRSFYIIIPFNGSAKTDFGIVREQLSSLSDIVSKGLSRISIQAQALRDLEVFDLFYSFYSPSQSKLQPLSEKVLSSISEALMHERKRP